MQWPPGKLCVTQEGALPGETKSRDMQTIRNFILRLHTRGLAILFHWGKSYFSKCSPSLHAYPVPRASILSCFLSGVFQVGITQDDVPNIPSPGKWLKHRALTKVWPLPQPAAVSFPRHQSQQWKCWQCEDKMAFLLSLPASRQSLAAERSPGRNPCGRTGRISESWQGLGASVPQHPLQTFPLCSRQYIKKWNKYLGTCSGVLRAPHRRNPITEDVYNCKGSSLALQSHFCGAAVRGSMPQRCWCSKVSSLKEKWGGKLTKILSIYLSHKNLHNSLQKALLLVARCYSLSLCFTIVLLLHFC